MYTSRICLSIILFFIGFTTTQAATTTVVANGQLIGLNDITVGADTYNVRFVEGSFISVFGDATGLDFTDYQKAGLAAHALKDTFNTFPTYDLAPSLTFGLTSDMSGQIFTPWFFQDNMTSSRNYKNAGIQDQFDTVTGSVGMIATYDTSPGNNFSGARVWADWQNIPNPPTLWLLGSGLIRLISVTRKKSELN